MKGSGIVLIIVFIFTASFRCGGEDREMGSCDRELGRHEPYCQAGFGYHAEGRVWILCLHGDTAERFRRGRAPELMEAAVDYADRRGVEDSPYGEFIDVSGGCGCLEGAGHECELYDLALYE